MKKIQLMATAILISCFGLGGFLHADIPADVTPELIAQGKELFNHKEGLKVKFACILCHQKEKAIEKSSLDKIGDGLPAVINKHITEKAKGTSLLPEDSQEIKALMAYIRYEHSK